jgi:hypothetical protein
LIDRGFHETRGKRRTVTVPLAIIRHQVTVIRKIRKVRKLRDNTIVIFTSDHNDLLGWHADMHQKWYAAYKGTVPEASRHGRQS